MDGAALLASTQTAMADSMTLQVEMQKLTLENQTEAAMIKAEYEAEMSGIKRIDKMADSLATATDAMTQAIQ